MQFEAHSGLMVPGIVALLGLSFICLWIRQTQNKHILAFGVAFFLFSVAVILSPVVLREITLPTIIVGNTAVVAAVCCISWGLAERGKTAFPIAPIILFGVVGTTITCWATVSYDHINYQMASNTSLFAVLFALSVVPIRQYAFQIQTESLLFWAVMFGAVQLFTVAVITFLDNGPIKIDGFQQTTYWAALNIIGVVCALSIAISLFAICTVDAFRDIELQSRMDSLTGISTRAALFESANLIFDDREPQTDPLCMIVADLDHFKDLNDKRGHVAGDDVLRLFGRLIRESLPETGEAGRIGGEEFCILLPNTSLYSAQRLAEVLRYQFEVGSAALSPGFEPETASFGVAMAQRDDDFEKLFSRCDNLLYEAKRLGRNQVRCEQHIPSLRQVA